MACQRIPENKIAKALERTASPLAQFSYVSNFLLKTSPLQCLALKIAEKNVLSSCYNVRPFFIFIEGRV